MDVELLEESRRLIDKHVEEIRKILKAVKYELGYDEIQPAIDKLEEFNDSL